VRFVLITCTSSIRSIVCVFFPCAVCLDYMYIQTRIPPPTTQTSFRCLL